MNNNNNIICLQYLYSVARRRRKYYTIVIYYYYIFRRFGNSAVDFLKNVYVLLLLFGISDAPIIVVRVKLCARFYNIENDLGDCPKQSTVTGGAAITVLLIKKY